jgi:hypothetical protein
VPKIALAGKYVLDFLRQTSVARQHKTFRRRVSGNGRSRNKVGFKKPPKHSQFKKGRSGNPHGRPKEYDAAAERRQLRALLGLLKTRSDGGLHGTGNPKSLNYLLWLIKELEIQIRLQAYDRLPDPASLDNASRGSKFIQRID